MFPCFRLNQAKHHGHTAYRLHFYAGILYSNWHSLLTFYIPNQLSALLLLLLALDSWR
jgi:hypothetical protein